MIGRTILSVALVLLTVSAAGAQERSAHANYVLRCAGCHGMEGAGTAEGGIPDFRGYVGAFTRTEAARTYVMHVPGVVSASLSDAEIAAVMNYLVEEWGGESIPDPFVPFTPNEVTRLRAVPVEDVVAFRREVVDDLAERGIATADYPWP